MSKYRMINDKWFFLSKNVKGIKSSEKRLKLFQYCRNLSTPAGFFSPRNTLLGRCRKKMEQRFSRTSAFLPGKENSCRVAIGYYEKNPFEPLKKFKDKS